MEKGVGRVLDALAAAHTVNSGTSGNPGNPGDQSQNQKPRVAPGHLEFYLQTPEEIAEQEWGDENWAAEIEMMYGKPEAAFDEKEKEKLKEQREGRREVKVRIAK